MRLFKSLAGFFTAATLAFALVALPQTADNLAVKNARVAGDKDFHPVPPAFRHQYGH